MEALRELEAKERLKMKGSDPLVLQLRDTAERLTADEPGLAERYYWLEAMINHVPDFIYAKDLEGRFLFANEAIVRTNGLSRVEEIVGKTEFDFHPHDASAVITEIERRVMDSGEADLGYEEPSLIENGSRWLMMSRVPLRDKLGNVIGVVGASRDISARKAAERLMQAQARLLEMIVRGVPLNRFMDEFAALIEKLVAGVRVVVLLEEPNRGPVVAAAPSLDCAERGIIDKQLSERCDLHQALQPLLQSASSTKCFVIPSADDGRYGLLALLELKDDTLDANHGEFLSAAAKVAGIAIDRSRAEERIRFLAQHDELTGLPNRMLLDGQIGDILKGASAVSRRVALAFVDLDNFKLVNDNLGHGAGDLLLTTVARRIETVVGRDGLVARIGGDEFIVVLQEGEENFAARVARLRQVVAEPLRIGDTDLQITCSVGMACFPDHGCSASDLLANADMAMYRVKESGRNGMAIFSADMAEKARRKFLRVEELRQAIVRDEFFLHFQPQLDLRSGAVIGLEALVRWEHPRDGLVSPGEFIPIAEESGLVVQIGDIVLRKACRQAKAWQALGLPPVKVSVNMSARQFQEHSMTSQVAAALAEAGLDPKWLEIEITESLIMRDMSANVKKMHQLKSLGVSLAIDDFGTGYSSLSALKSFPLSCLKIDRSFIMDIPRNSDDMAITSAIVSLAQKLGLDVIAEGVETQAQADFLLETGCHQIQGYYFSRPLAADAIAGILLTHGA